MGEQAWPREQAGRPAWQLSRIAAVDGALVRLGRGGGGLRLWLGEVLQAMSTRGMHHALGFSSLGAYALERCGRSERWALDTCAVARQLAELPRLRAALLQGEVSWCMAAEVARHATAENETFLVALAKRSSVRRMRALFRQGRAGGVGDAGGDAGGDANRGEDADSGGDANNSDDADAGDDASPARRPVRRRVDHEVAVLFEGMRELVAIHVGSRASDAIWEALLAEGMTALGKFGAEIREPDVRSAAVSNSDLEPEPPAWTPPPMVVLEWVLPEDARGLDAEAVRLARELSRRDVELGELSLQMRELGGARLLGYASDRQYCEQRLGLSYTSVKDRQTLVRRVSRLPELQEALEDGELGFEAARLLARLATQETVAAWVARAKQRTFKHLREEAGAAEVVARLSGGVVAVPPPVTAAALPEASAPPDESRLFGEVASTDDDPTAVAPAKLGRVTLPLWMSHELAVLYGELELSWQRAGCPYGDFLRFLCVTFWKVWEPSFHSDVAYAEIYDRDEWQCASPTCTRRDVTPHHLTFRSHGGGDDEENVVALCSWCHLHGIHTHGSIRALAPATHMLWKTPVLEVRGREVAWRA